MDVHSGVNDTSGRPIEQLREPLVCSLELHVEDCDSGSGPCKSGSLARPRFRRQVCYLVMPVQNASLLPCFVVASKWHRGARYFYIWC